MIRTECPACRERYRLRDELGGKWVQCRQCLGAFQVERRYTERFEAFLDRAPKPTRSGPKLMRKRELPNGKTPVPVIEWRSPASLDAESLKLVGLGVSGLVVMALTSAVSFAIARVVMT